MQGKLALDSLNLEKLGGAIAAFERAVVELPSYAPAHAGLANAYLLQVRTDAIGQRARPRPVDARHGGREAGMRASIHRSARAGRCSGICCRPPARPKRRRPRRRRAAALEPDNWRHQYRLAYSAWGEERLRAADRALTLMPGFAPVRMLSAMVFIARGTLDRAEREATVGAESQRRQRGDRTPLAGDRVPLVARTVAGGARRCAGRAGEPRRGERHDASGHIYAREFVLNARVAAGFMQLTMNDAPAAAATFQQALAKRPGTRAPRWGSTP